jgi:hypothetical protein
MKASLSKTFKKETEKCMKALKNLMYAASMVALLFAFVYANEEEGPGEPNPWPEECMHTYEGETICHYLNWNGITWQGTQNFYSSLTPPEGEYHRMNFTGETKETTHWGYWKTVQYHYYAYKKVLSE